MRVDLNWVIGVIRAGDEATFLGPEAGTSYEFVCSVMIKGDEAYLYGAHGKLNRAVYKEIYKILKSHGVSTITYERLNTEKLREREISTQGELTWPNNKKS